MRHVRIIAKIKRAAEKRGERDAALFLIQEFVNHAGEIDHSNIPASDKLAIRFIVRAMREILAGKNPKAALCLDAEGRSRVPFARDLSIALRVFEQYEKLKKRAKESDGGAVNWAIGEVAKQRKIGKATIRAAWRLNGGIKGVTALAKEFDYDPATARALRERPKKG